MSSMKSERKELAQHDGNKKTKKSEAKHSIQSPAIDSTQNTSSSTSQTQDKEIQPHRPRGRPRKYPINDAPIKQNNKDLDEQSSQTQTLSPSAKSKKQDSASNSAMKHRNEQEVSQHDHQNAIAIEIDDNKQRAHHAKNGNIVYKNIRNKNNNGTTTSNAAEPPPVFGCGYNYIVTHSRLETIETRINDNQIPEMIHPAQSIVYDRLHQEPLLLSPEEVEKRKNYRIIHTLKRIPACWEPRPWDTPEEKMTKFENIEYAEMIENFEPVDSEGNIREWYKSKDSKTQSKKKKKGKSFPFIASLVNFSTDDFDDDTDLEYYY